MANGRHSYVAFYPSDWLAGTARMTRMHRSIYFDICCFIWDQNKPCPVSEQRLMLGDIPDWETLVGDLVKGGKLILLDDGALTNLRAEAEAEKSFGLWKKKSAGGTAGAKKTNSSKSAGGSAAKSGDGTADDTLDGTGPGLPPQNQNQNQTLPEGKPSGPTLFETEPAEASPNPDKIFWDSAKAYLGKSKSSLIGKWAAKHGKPETMAAIAASQSERAIDPVAFIEGFFRQRAKQQAASDDPAMPDYC